MQQTYANFIAWQQLEPVPVFQLSLLHPCGQQFQPFSFGPFAVPPQLRMHLATAEQENLLHNTTMNPSTASTRDEDCCSSQMCDVCCSTDKATGETLCVGMVKCLDSL
jgi:hypothetical protein